MSFRIRNMSFNTDEEEAESVRCEKLYREHLKQFNKRSNRDLWKFFTEDFFHDGSICSMRFEPGLETLTMEINSPNIRRIYDESRYEYVSVDFVCIFIGVTKFTVEQVVEKGKEEWCESDGPSKFLYAEINTCLPENTYADEDQSYSLLIETLKDRCAYITILFSQVDVRAKEAVAFELMEADPRFDVPVYKEK